MANRPRGYSGGHKRDGGGSGGFWIIVIVGCLLALVVGFLL